MNKYQANQYQYHVNLSKENDKDIIDFLKVQSKIIKTSRIMINIMIMLFGKQDISNVYNEIEKYGLINVLNKRMSNLKQKS